MRGVNYGKRYNIIFASSIDIIKGFTYGTTVVPLESGVSPICMKADEYDELIKSGTAPEDSYYKTIVLHHWQLEQVGR